MNRLPYNAAVIAFLLLAGCAGIVTPSHHEPEAYSDVDAAAAKGDMVTLKRDLTADPALLKHAEWDGRTLLHDAVDNSKIAVASFLLDSGADVNAVTVDGRTPLHMAAQRGDMAMISLLLGCGANPQLKDNKGWTPFDRAVKWGHPDAAALLRNAMPRDKIGMQLGHGLALDSFVATQTERCPRILDPS
jgi:ankyrin repeat protein